jgi:thymidylate kinase
MVKLEPNRWVVVNAERKWDDVQIDLRRVIEGRMIATS